MGCRQSRTVDEDVQPLMRGPERNKSVVMWSDIKNTDKKYYTCGIETPPDYTDTNSWIKNTAEVQQINYIPESIEKILLNMGRGCKPLENFEIALVTKAKETSDQAAEQITDMLSENIISYNLSVMIGYEMKLTHQILNRHNDTLEFKCLKCDTKAVMRCPDCNVTRYCSDNCHSKDTAIHQHSCWTYRTKLI
jgi:hypothetical protein